MIRYRVMVWPELSADPYCAESDALTLKAAERLMDQVMADIPEDSDVYIERYETVIGPQWVKARGGYYGE